LAWTSVPSIAMTPTLTKPERAQSSSTSPNNPAIAVSWRSMNRAIVAWSGRCCAPTTPKATSSTHARSMTRQERIPRA